MSAILNVFSSGYFQKRNHSSRVFTSLRTCKFLQFSVLCTSVYFTLPNQIFRIDNCSKRTSWLSLSFIQLNRREKVQDSGKTLLNVKINETRNFLVSLIFTFNSVFSPKLGLFNSFQIQLSSSKYKVSIHLKFNSWLLRSPGIAWQHKHSLSCSPSKLTQILHSPTTYDARRSKKPRIRFQVNRHFVSTRW